MAKQKPTIGILGPNSAVAKLLKVDLHMLGYSVSDINRDFVGFDSNDVIINCAGEIAIEEKMDEANVHFLTTALNKLSDDQIFVNISSLGIYGGDIRKGSAPDAQKLTPITYYEKTKAQGHLLVNNRRNSINVVVGSVIEARPLLKFKLLLRLLRFGLINPEDNGISYITLSKDLARSIADIIHKDDSTATVFVFFNLEHSSVSIQKIWTRPTNAIFKFTLKLFFPEYFRIIYQTKFVELQPNYGSKLSWENYKLNYLE